MSKDEFFKDRYETPDRETVLEAENKRLKSRIEELEGGWCYYPERPETYADVWLAFREVDHARLGYASSHSWFYGDNSEVRGEEPYAWKYVSAPPVPDFPA